MSQAMRFEEILRKLAVVDEGFADDQTGLVLGAFGYDIEAALEDPDGT